MGAYIVFVRERTDARRRVNWNAHLRLPDSANAVTQADECGSALQADHLRARKRSGVPTVGPRATD
jgi:hypothetical protein